MGTLDEGINKLLAPLVRLDVTWSRKQRQEVFDQLNEFVRDFNIVNAIRWSYETFVEYRGPGVLDKGIFKSIETPLQNLSHEAIQFLATVNPDENYDYRLTEEELAELWRRLSRTDDDSELMSIAREIQQRIPKTHGFVSRAAGEFGTIKGVILRHYPSMPAPLWVDKVP